MVFKPLCELKSIRKRKAYLGVALHFEGPLRENNLSFLDIIKTNKAQIEQDIEWEFKAEPWGERWAQAEFRIPYEGDFPTTDIAPEAAKIMKILIDRTWPIIESRIKE